MNDHGAVERRGSRGASLAELVSLAGQHVVVTGGSSGIGLASVRRVVEAGARATVLDLPGASRPDEMAGLRDLVDFVEADVSSLNQVKSAATEVVARYGRIDGWVNNAGVYPETPLLTYDPDVWRRVMAVNVDGVLHGLRIAGDLMSAAGRGVIVNIESTASFRPRLPSHVAYVASKHAVNGLTKNAALALAPRGVRVLGVAPTTVDGTPAALGGAINPGAEPMWSVAEVPLGRRPTADDVAGVVLFCLSGLSQMMTGSTLLVDGGFMIT